MICVDAVYPSHAPTGKVNKMEKLELYFKNVTNWGYMELSNPLLSNKQFKWGYNYIQYGDGIALKGYRIEQNGTYEVWLHGGFAWTAETHGDMTFDQLSQITVRKCPGEHEMRDPAATACDSAFVEETKLDKCVADERVVFSNEDRTITFPKDKGEHIVISKVGIPVQQTSSPPTSGGPRYYWEVTVNGTLQHFVNYQSPQSVSIGASTRDYNNQGLFLGGDNQAFAYGNSYDTGNWYSGGSSSTYGNVFLPGDTVQIAFDTNTNTFWVGINDTWQSNCGGWDGPGTTYNSYPEANSTNFSCHPPRYEEVMSQSMIDYTGRANCPIPDGKPSCNDYDWMTGKNRPHCCHGNPVADNQCSVGTVNTWWGQHGKKIATTDFVQLKKDPFDEDNIKLYPAFQGDGKFGTMSYTVNFGDEPFKYAMPCTFQPISDLVNAGTASYVGPASSNCMTCKGKCLDHDASGQPGEYFCKTYASEAGNEGTDQYYYDKFGMVPPS